MKKNEIMLRPTYWACVSGGKDSLFMLNYILNNLNKYPLDAVVHFELEIDFPFIKNVIDYMQNACEKHGIKFLRIKPRKTWEELYYTKCISKNGYETIYGFPTRVGRWCNEKYKLDAGKQLEDYVNSFGCYTVRYIGFCADEERRFKIQTNVIREIYPLAEAGICENDIWELAKHEPIFNNYYKTQKRCGCMYCPLSSFINYAYLYKYYPEKFQYMIKKMKETELLRLQETGKPCSVTSSNPKYNADYIVHIVKNKWLHKLNEMELEK